MRHLQRIWICVFSQCFVSYDIWICLCFDLCLCPHILIRTGIRKFFFILMLRIIYHWGHGSACWRPFRHWLYLGLSFRRSPVCPVAGGFSVWRLLGPVFCVLWLVFFFSLSVCLSFSLVINVYLTFCWVGNMCPCQLSVSGFEGNLFALSRPGRPMIAAHGLNGSSFINNLFMFCLWKINAADKHVFWCHFHMYDDYLSCCCFWKIKDSWFLIPDSVLYGHSTLYLTGSRIGFEKWKRNMNGFIFQNIIRLPVTVYVSGCI